MEPKKSLLLNLRVSNIPDTDLNDVKASALRFNKEVKAILKDVDLTDDVYYDFNLTESEWIDPKFDTDEFEGSKYRRRRI